MRGIVCAAVVATVACFGPGARTASAAFPEPAGGPLAFLRAGSNAVWLTTTAGHLDRTIPVPLTSSTTPLLTLALAPMHGGSDNQYGDFFAVGIRINGAAEVIEADATPNRLVHQVIGATDPTFDEHGALLFTGPMPGTSRTAIFLLHHGNSWRRLTSPGRLASDSEPSWSINNQLAFVRGRPGACGTVSNLFVTLPGHPDEVRQLTSDGTAADPDWSPDGRQLLFDAASTGPCSAGDHAPRRIEVVNANGTDLHEVTPGTNPSWSGDQTSLTFDRGASVYVAGIDGSDPRRVAAGFAPRWAYPGWGSPADGLVPKGKKGGGGDEFCSVYHHPRPPRRRCINF